MTQRWKIILKLLLIMNIGDLITTFARILLRQKVY